MALPWLSPLNTYLKIVIEKKKSKKKSEGQEKIPKLAKGKISQKTGTRAPPLKYGPPPN